MRSTPRGARILVRTDFRASLETTLQARLRHCSRRTGHRRVLGQGRKPSHYRGEQRERNSPSQGSPSASHAARSLVVPCQSNLSHAAPRNGRPERNGGVGQIALARYNQRCMAKKTHDKLLKTLQQRFEQHMERHMDLEWAQVRARLAKSAAALAALAAMEESGGEPDVVGGALKSGAVRFFDCSAESPAGRRSLCFDRAALDTRKEHKPVGSAVELAAEMGVELLGEAQYRELQRFGEFDLKTSSWVRTPHEIRELGGALFCDRRYGAVFVYHNGAQSYYAARGFRAALEV